MGWKQCYVVRGWKILHERRHRCPPSRFFDRKLCKYPNSPFSFLLFLSFHLSQTNQLTTNKKKKAYITLGKHIISDIGKPVHFGTGYISLSFCLYIYFQYFYFYFSQTHFFYRYGTLGQLDDVALWNRTLSPPEILHLYENGFIGAEEGLVLLYDFDDPQFVFTNIARNKGYAGVSNNLKKSLFYFSFHSLFHLIYRLSI